MAVEITLEPDGVGVLQENGSFHNEAFLLVPRAIQQDISLLLLFARGTVNTLTPVNIKSKSGFYKTSSFILYIFYFDTIACSANKKEFYLDKRKNWIENKVC